MRKKVDVPPNRKGNFAGPFVTINRWIGQTTQTLKWIKPERKWATIMDVVDENTIWFGNNSTWERVSFFSTIPIEYLTFFFFSFIVILKIAHFSLWWIGLLLAFGNDPTAPAGWPGGWPAELKLTFLSLFFFFPCCLPFCSRVIKMSPFHYCVIRRGRGNEGPYRSSRRTPHRRSHSTDLLHFKCTKPHFKHRRYFSTTTCTLIYSKLPAKIDHQIGPLGQWTFIYLKWLEIWPTLIKIAKIRVCPHFFFARSTITTM